MSLSSRRAWIEMRKSAVSTDRRVTSLSSRRAWIEIIVLSLEYGIYPVALLAESVD